MLPGRLVSWSATGGSHSTTPMPTAQATLRSGRRRSSAGAADGAHDDRAEREGDQPDGQGQVRHVGLRAQDGERR